jgi:hypothetical protein
MYFWFSNLPCRVVCAPKPRTRGARQMKSMEVEVRTLDARHKSKCTQMLAQFRADIATQKKHFDRLQVPHVFPVNEYRVIDSSDDIRTKSGRI